MINKIALKYQISITLVQKVYYIQIKFETKLQLINEFLSPEIIAIDFNTFFHLGTSFWFARLKKFHILRIKIDNFI